MKTLLGLAILIFITAGCRPQNVLPHSQKGSSPSVQLLNEGVLGSPPTTPVPVLRPCDPRDWVPTQVVLDYAGNRCRGALVYYDKSLPFEQLRAAINEDFADDEVASFQADPEMGIWRNERDQFAIQLTEDDDYLLAIYLTFVDPHVAVTKLGKAIKDNSGSSNVGPDIPQETREPLDRFP